MAPKKQIAATTVEEAINYMREGVVAGLEAAAEGLIRIFGNPTNQSALPSLSDKGYHALLHELFRTVLAEKARLYGPKGPKHKEQGSVADRLRSLGTAVQKIVEAGAGTLKRKTMLAIVDHIDQTIQHPNGEFVGPLFQGYIKAVAALLDAPERVELLATYESTGWIACLDFALKTIQPFIEGGESHGASPRASPVPNSTASFPAAKSTFTSTASSSWHQKTGNLKPKPTSSLRDLLRCLLSLLSASNAPVSQHSIDVSTVVVRVLQLHVQGNQLRAQGSDYVPLALSILDVLLETAQIQDTEHANNLTSDLLPLVCRLWPVVHKLGEPSLLNTQSGILKTLFIMQLNLEYLAQQGNPHTLVEIENICEVLWTEYSRRRDERAQLAQDDLTFSTLPRPKHSFNTKLFGLRLGHVEAEQKWSLVHILSFLDGILWSDSRAHALPSGEDDPQPRKKRRIHEGTSRLHQKLHSRDESVQLTALQVVPFCVSSSTMTDSDIYETLSSLVSATGHKSTIVAVWAMIASASLAQTSFASHESMSSFWIQLWHIAARNVNILSNCRAASVLLETILSNDLVPYRDISDDITNIVTTAGPWGPAIAVDSSIALMTHLLQLRNYHVPNVSYTTCNNVVRWLFLKWSPADAGFTSRYSAHVTPLDIVNLLRAAYGNPAVVLSAQPQAISGTLGETWSTLQERRGFVQYLLLLEDSYPGTSRLASKDSTAHSILQMPDTSDSHATRKLVAELLHTKVEEIGILCDSWNSSGEGPPQISSEKLQSLICCLIVVAFIVPNLNQVNSRQSQELEPKASKVLLDTLKALSEATDSHSLYEGIFGALRPYLPGCSTAALDSMLKEVPLLLRLFSDIADASSQRDPGQVSGTLGNAMDLDDFSEPQESKPRTVSKTVQVPRRVSTALKANSFFPDTMQRLHLVRALQTNPGQAGHVPQAFLDKLLSTTDDEFLSCGCFIYELVFSDIVISPENAHSMVKKLCSMIEKGLFSTCEIALTTCLHVIRGFIPLWARETTALSDSVGQMYSWFFEQAFIQNQLSPKVQVALAQLLLDLTQANEGFPASIELPMTVDSLLEMLMRGSMAVKIFISSKIPDIFKRYVLKTHESVFKNVVAALPGDGATREGTALRLFCLGEVAQVWPTLLRQCVYYIFETSGLIPGTAMHATRCLKKMASKLKLDNAQGLFDLFAPQLLYTWLGRNPFHEIPFGIFEFPSVEESVRRAKSEAVALMVMRGQDTMLAGLASSLGVSLEQLVEDCFAKIMAYSIAHDFAMPKSYQVPSGESRIKKLLGRERYHTNIHVHFADIVALFFSLVEQDDPFEKWFSQDESFAYAAIAMADIKKFGHSGMELPLNIQPAFRGKFLTRQISHLCSRTEYELPSIWTPVLVVFIARKLFNMIHPALGALHACSVIRKVRVLMCLAGSMVCEAYPMECLLHSLRPWLVDSECADDALGMTQYLLKHGVSALSYAPSFLAGYALSTLVSLRVFLESSQASTTQESQHQATMNKVQRFHSWFSIYLDEYKSTKFENEQQRASFKDITRSAARVRSCGNAERGTYESKLLLEILRDESDRMPLLNETSRKLALDMLSRNFKFPASFREDVINSDLEALGVATAVWRSSQAEPSSENYMVWAGRVVGRGFAASGEIDGSLLRESSLSYSRHRTGVASSQQELLGLLQSLTTDDDPYFSGLAESALRNIFTAAVNHQDNFLQEACSQVVRSQLRASSDWTPFQQPPSDTTSTDSVSRDLALSPDAIESHQWCQRLMVHLTQSVPGNVVLGALTQIFTCVKGFAEKAFPFVIHLVLLAERDAKQSAKQRLSAALKGWLAMDSRKAKDNLKLMINALLYLRNQRWPGESSIADRSQWLDVDLTAAASTATRCGMYKTALLFVESVASEGSRSSRRSSAIRAQESTDVLLEIFENIDDPDAYYGLSDTASLNNVLARLEYEKDASKCLAFRGAQYDSHTRRRDPMASVDGQSIVSTLSNFGLSGMSHALQSQLDVNGTASVDSTFDNARRLEIWDLPVPASTENPTIMLYRAYQGCHQANTMEAARSAIHSGLCQTMQVLVQRDTNSVNIRHNLGTLAALTELDDALNASDSSELDRILTIYEDRSTWMKSGRYPDVRHLLSCRETSLSLLGHNIHVRAAGDINKPNARLAEIKSMLLSSSVYRFHQATQETLNIATSLNDLIAPSLELGLTVDAAAKLEAANALWDHDQIGPSIGMLQSIHQDSDLKKQTVLVSRSDLLAKLGHQVSVARLEKPESIQKNYLQPSLKELKGKLDGKEAGKVYHQFATFCDEQLQNPDGLEDLALLQQLRQRKSGEVTKLKELIANTREYHAKSKLQRELNKEETWLDLDDQELRRLEQSRTEFVRLSLENYLLSLIASDEHNNDALRFTALWLERSGEEFANKAVAKYLGKVPTRKFAPLMNQLTSRLLDRDSTFQRLLTDLVYRICVDHPYHGMYHIWSGAKSRTNMQDDAAVLRHKAAEGLSHALSTTQAVQNTWNSINVTNKAYHNLAAERDSSRYKQGQKIKMADSTAGSKLISTLHRVPIPPPTMQLELSAARDYSRVPHISRLEPIMTIASGISAPKIVTAIGSNGQKFRQLLKGGNDELRQDAIMEQVFSAVSDVLKLHRATKQRNLGIRTYKVLPLTATSGLIEFVANTIPLSDYLMPAHERYHPKDHKGSHCRKEISCVERQSVEQRLAVYKKVADRFKPVMRYFFMERFVDPDEWFAKRTAYTRTTAVMSMLGHVLGVGDRHGNNILIDARTGEVVHIDLGVAFEMGRVLPVPELVPFRLTRDVVDGMGITGTEGVFRRCCEFTLDALREETYSIMTILDVLRYDPLHEWSISGVRMARLQDARRGENEWAADDGGFGDNDPRRRKAQGGRVGLVNEPSGADRALEVVKKKLSKTLSVTATVNDLINQATDERNLAVLYSGWAAYA